MSVARSGRAQADVAGAASHGVRPPAPRLKFGLPWPPPANNLFRSGIVKGKVMRFQSRDYREWLQRAKVQLAAQGVPRRLINVRVVVEIVAFPKLGNQRDVDSFAKSVLDLLQSAGVLENDRVVKRLVQEIREPERREPFVEVEVVAL